MSRLNFSSVNEAFLLGSEQITNTQKEIAKLKALVLETSLSPNSEKVLEKTEKTEKPEKNESISKSPVVLDKERPEHPKVQPKQQNNDSLTFDYMMISVMSHPRFDELVHNYMLLKRPELFNIQQKMNNLQNIDVGSQNVNIGPYTKESFGQEYSASICFEIKRYIFFFIFSVVIFLFLTYILERKA